jgi:U3 small nucleolar RNA-associated protein 3
LSNNHEGKRKTSDKILKNRGLVPHRNKENKNSRVKLKNKFKKKTSGYNFKTIESGDYTGEKNIKTNVVKSKKFKH